jgi:prephenate dehydratase
MPDFQSTAGAVMTGEADVAVLPVENVVAGCVTDSIDAILAAPELRVIAETALPVRHQLLALHGASLESIRWVESHPMALAQCRRWLSRHPHLEAIPVEDTAGAALAVASSGDRRRAALASATAGRVYGLETLERDVQDHDLNETRFWALATRYSAVFTRGEAKAVVVLTMPRERDALGSALRPEGWRDISARVLTMRPGEHHHEHRYVVELQHDDVAAISRAIDELRTGVPTLRVLGEYRLKARAE